jgi:hypothetical protein
MATRRGSRASDRITTGRGSQEVGQAERVIVAATFAAFSGFLNAPAIPAGPAGAGLVPAIPAGCLLHRGRLLRRWQLLPSSGELTVLTHCDLPFGPGARVQYLDGSRIQGMRRRRRYHLIWW